MSTDDDYFKNVLIVLTCFCYFHTLQWQLVYEIRKFVELPGDEVNDDANEIITSGNSRINKNKKITRWSFGCKTKIIGSTQDGHGSFCSIKTFE